MPVKDALEVLIKISYVTLRLWHQCETGISGETVIDSDRILLNLSSGAGTQRIYNSQPCSDIDHPTSHDEWFTPIIARIWNPVGPKEASVSCIERKDMSMVYVC